MKIKIILSVFIVVVAVILIIFAQGNKVGEKKEIIFSNDLTLKQLAKKNAVPVKEIIHILSHEDPAAWELPYDIPVNELKIDQDQLREAIEHAGMESKPLIEIIKYILWAIFLSIVLVLVMTRKKISKIRIIILIVTLIVFGIVLGASPNPMESLVKLFKMFNRMEGDSRILIPVFIIFSLFSIIGSKFICGWGCQLGAFQETIFNIPLFKRKKKFKLPFVISLFARVVLFIVFIAFLFGLVFSIKNFVVYHHINYFKLFNFSTLATVALYTLPVLIISSFFLYRPFCQLVCPFGLYTWLLENIAINRIRIDPQKCIDCEKCVKECPTQAMKGIYKSKRKVFLPDCWSCGACIEICPTDAIIYTHKKIKNKAEE